MVNGRETEGHGAQATLPLAAMASITLKLCELGLAAAASNDGGGVPSPEVRHVLNRLAMAAPGVAVRLPNVRATLSPEILALAQVSALRATPTPEQPPAQADSGRRLTAQEAAGELGITAQAVRAAATRGSLPGRLGLDGRWKFAQSDVQTYGRTHAKGQ